MCHKEFFENRVIVCWFPPNMTNFFQPIDERTGRSVHTSTGQFLDSWLTEGKNMEIWEAKIIAGEHEILMDGFCFQSDEQINGIRLSYISCE